MSLGPFGHAPWVINFHRLIMGKNFKKSSLKPWDPLLLYLAMSSCPIHKSCQPCPFGPNWPCSRVTCSHRLVMKKLKLECTVHGVPSQIPMLSKKFNDFWPHPQGHQFDPRVKTLLVSCSTCHPLQFDMSHEKMWKNNYARNCKIYLL